MQCKTNIVDDKAYIRPNQDGGSAQVWDGVSDACEALCEQGKKTIVLDLAGVDVMDSHAIAGILVCYRFLKKEGGVLKIRPVHGPVKEALEMLRLDRLLPVEE